MKKAATVACLIALVVFLQYDYDAARPAAAEGVAGALSPGLIRAFDMGFHPAIASFFWIPTMPEVIDFFRNKTEYFGDLAEVLAIDPKLSYPYAFSVLTLPALPNVPDGIGAATKIGKDGLANADPDWRIPYYMATNYYLALKDKKDALTYYDIAARTPGIPAFAERFSLNFGIGSNERETTKALWESIRDTTNDDFTKERAQAYVDRLNDFDYIEAAAQQYKKTYGKTPTSTDALLAAHIIPSLPQDPFGFTFIIRPDGTAGIDTTKLPPGYTDGSGQ